MPWSDRRAAGRELAGRLTHLRGRNMVVVGLPRGGVLVAAEVARALGSPLDVVVVRKLGVPGQPEVAMGAIGEDGARVVNDAVLRSTGTSPGELAEVEAVEGRVLRRRAELYRGGHRPRTDLRRREVLVVDDGLATGATARAACQVVRALGAFRVVFAVPVAPPGWTARMADAADELLCPYTPDDFYGVGQFYTDFRQVGDEEVMACLDTPKLRPRRAEPPQTE